MERKFSQFTNTKISEEEVAKKAEDVKKENPEAFKQVNDLYNKYSGYSNDKLMQELFNVVSEQKKNGTFNPNKLEEMTRMVFPMLSEEQKETFKNLMEQIK